MKGTLKVALWILGIAALGAAAMYVNVQELLRDTLGSLTGSLAALGSGARARTPGEWALYTVGLLATVVVTLYVTRRAQVVPGFYNTASGRFDSRSTPTTSKPSPTGRR